MTGSAGLPLVQAGLHPDRLHEVGGAVLLGQVHHEPADGSVESHSNHEDLLPPLLVFGLSLARIVIVNPLLAEDLLQEGRGGVPSLRLVVVPEEGVWREGGRTVLRQDRHFRVELGGGLRCPRSLVEQFSEQTVVVQTPDNADHQVGIVVSVIAEGHPLAAATHWEEILVKAKLLVVDQGL